MSSPGHGQDHAWRRLLMKPTLKRANALTHAHVRQVRIKGYGGSNSAFRPMRPESFARGSNSNKTTTANIGVVKGSE